MGRSLRQQLLLLALALTALTAPVVWWMLERAVHRFAEAVVDAELEAQGQQLQSLWLASQAAPGPGTRDFSVFLASPQGAVEWQVAPEGQPVRRSRALEEAAAQLDTPPMEPSENWDIDSRDTPIGRYRVGERVALEIPSNPALQRRPPGDDPAMRGLHRPPVTVATHYSVALNQASYDHAVRKYTKRLQKLLLTLLLPILLVLVVVLVGVFVGLTRALGRVGRALARFDAGETETLSGHFPSELQALVDEINGLLARNRKLLVRTRRYITKIAHDINHPLAIIQNALPAPATVPAGSGTPEPDRDRMNRMVHAQVQRIGGLVQRYTSLAKAMGPDEGGPQPLSDVTTLVRDVADGFALVWRRTPVAIEVDVDEALTVAIPSYDLEAMLANLVSNAHKHAAGRIVIAAHRQEGRLALEVRDDGPGIPAAEREAAFNWGKRLDEAPPGTGFGLSIVRDIAALHDGEVTLGEAAEGGLRASISLPLPSAAKRSLRGGQAFPSPS